MPARPLTSRPPTLGDLIDRADTLAELDRLMSDAACLADPRLGHQYGDEVLCRALLVLARGRPAEEAARRLVRKWTKMERPYFQV